MRDENKSPSIIVLHDHETVLQSWVKDAGTYGGAFALAMLGKWLGSGALSWFGIACLALALLARAGHAADKRMTPRQAVEYIRTKFPSEVKE